MSDSSSRLIRSLPLIGGLLLFLSALALFLYGTRVETRRFRLEKLRLALGQNKGAATKSAYDEKLRILHISDLHLRDSDQKKVDFIRAITDDDFDLVVLTGDIFQFSQGLDFAPFLLSRKPRLGAYAVFGNHDYFDYSLVNKTIGRIFPKMRTPDARKDITPLRRALEGGGFTVLVNEAVTLAEPNIFIVGVDYPGIKDDALAALMQDAPANALKLALFHLPWKLAQLASAGFDLVFGGHTHGGQIRLPGFGALITDSELGRSEASGLLRRDNTYFHISRGLGADPRSNLRLFCPPAATVIEINRKL
ncbi:MAG: metallophosphoesterase [Cyanobacteria bacterium REEB67]|nr:metallophosphoesterase [Cyanobacteria bacterium REEB67]